MLIKIKKTRPKFSYKIIIKINSKLSRIKLKRNKIWDSFTDYTNSELAEPQFYF